MRDELISELIKETLGPRDGAEEILFANPFKEYITGVIIPQTCKLEVDDPDSEITTDFGEGGIADDEAPDDGVGTTSPSDLNPQLRPKSFGLSFTIRGEEPELKICATWGRYTHSHREKRACWIRTPYKSIKAVKLDKSDKPKIISLSNSGDSGAQLQVRCTHRPNSKVVFISFLNVTKTPDANCSKIFADVSIFQPSIRVIIAGGELSETHSAGKNPKDKDLLPFLYRNKNKSARGHMCSAIWKEIDYCTNFSQAVLWPDGFHFEGCEEFGSPDVRSEFLPLYATIAPEFGFNARTERQPVLSAELLSQVWAQEDIDAALEPMAEGYDLWIKESEHDISQLNVYERETSAEILKLHTIALGRIRSGIELLKKDKDARLAFCFANRSIWLQRKWKTGGDLKWRPFQLAFVMMNLEPVYDRSSAARKSVDLLWIPTGGGKTEAYLAIVAYAMALRRRKASNNMNGDRTGGGTAVITRYTLRLLTIQQFRRTLTMVTAADYLRVMKCNGRVGWRPDCCELDQNWIYGSMKFSTGMWVGGGVSPNHLRQKGQAIDALLGEQQDGRNEPAEGEPAQIITCPVCDTWLTVPNAGLPEGENTIHLLFKKAPDSLSDYLDDIEGIPGVRKASVTRRGLPDGYVTMSLTVSKEQEPPVSLDENGIDSIGTKIKSLTQMDIVPFRASRPGYFGHSPEPGRTGNRPPDFDIYCPNPDCDLNRNITYKEGVPLSPQGDAERFPDGLVAKQVPEPFSAHNRMPIPALTVDEQVYQQCPTVIVSTADKIARLAYEPRAASIFGNVEKYNAFYGYYREELLSDRTTTKQAKSQIYTRDVSPFDPPDLIIQDELHLMEGPLGSMFGLYETTVEALIQGGWKRLGKEVWPKYIASSATVKNAETQVRDLFARELFQFPPHGLRVDDNFFVRKPEYVDSWSPDSAGRIYMGICTPGMGQLTSIARIWARLLKARNDNVSDTKYKNFRTLVGYFNAIRELGGARALYREDIVERLRAISGGSMLLDADNIYEISSRISSTDIPQLLDELEKAAEGPDALFTTSMFGTGVDIPHLSLMVVNGQPKTTSQYVQATGRVGRQISGLVVTFLKAARPRDLNHYEMFARYHERIYMEVEPVSVSPFSKGALDRASGPVFVSYLRNKTTPAVAWYDDKGDVILLKNAKNDIESFLKYLQERLESSDERAASSASEVVSFFETQIQKWENNARELTGKAFVFWELPPSRFHEISKNIVLGDAHHQRGGFVVVYFNAPQSLREIEETTSFRV